MKTTSSHSQAFRSPNGNEGGSTPPPVVFTSGAERLTVSFVSPAAINLVYSTPQLSSRLKLPLPINSLVPVSPVSQSVLSLLLISQSMRLVARNGVLGATPPTQPLGALFYEGQVKIFVNGLTGDSMDDDDVVILPSGT